MPAIRLLFLWHMHQPYYKDLVTGEYRLPWVRLHALKDYYGMVKLLDEFPAVHQTFNLVPALIAQIQDYVAGGAHDPFLDLAAKPAGELDSNERLFALRYLFQANQQNMIGRYPRYKELFDEFGSQPESAPQAVSRLRKTDLTDLQVLSQIAWMDEFFQEDPDIIELVKKGHDYSLEDQRIVIHKQKEFLAKVLPAYSAAAQRGSIEISTSPYYHPILPLIYDSDTGPASNPYPPQPAQRFRHPEDAREQIARALHLHEQVFGIRPRGMWPSEGGVSDDVLGLAHELGLVWVATDEGVLGRSLQRSFDRDSTGKLLPESAEALYRIFRWEREADSMSVIFRDHTLSDLIGFVYSGMPAQQAAQDFIRRLKESAEPILQKGKDAVIPVILDGENAWEFYPRSGRDFLRWLYRGIESDPAFKAQTVSEALAEEKSAAPLASIFPGSWINANFDVWIGSAEDNVSWDQLAAAHDFYTEHAAQASPQQRELAYEELLIAEGSDWNWWYGPEHHSANDREFDELYRKHLANVYHALGAEPPETLALPIISALLKPRVIPQTAYIHPQMDGKATGYFDWLGAAMCVADRRSSAMHGKTFLMDTAYAGIDGANLYARLDFLGVLSEWPPSLLIVTIECQAAESKTYPSRMEVNIEEGRISNWEFRSDEGGAAKTGSILRVAGNSGVEFSFPLAQLHAQMGSKLKLRFSLWRNRLPLDALPPEGWMELPVIPEDELGSLAYAKP